MDRDGRGIMVCLFVPLAAAVLGPIVWIGLGVYEVIRTGSPWYWRDLIHLYQGVAVICLPALLISYLLFHFLLRPQIAGRYKNPCKTLAFVGGGGLAFIFLIVMILVGVTCSEGRWINTRFISSFLRGRTDAMLVLSILVISSISLGFLAGVFLPKNILLVDTARTSNPVGKKLVVSSLTLIFLLCALWGS